MPAASSALFPADAMVADPPAATLASRWRRQRLTVVHGATLIRRTAFLYDVLLPTLGRRRADVLSASSGAGAVGSAPAASSIATVDRRQPSAAPAELPLVLVVGLPNALERLKQALDQALPTAIDAPMPPATLNAAIERCGTQRGAQVMLMLTGLDVALARDDAPSQAFLEALDAVLVDRNLPLHVLASVQDPDLAWLRSAQQRANGAPPNPFALSATPTAAENLDWLVSVQAAVRRVTQQARASEPAGLRRDAAAAPAQGARTSPPEPHGPPAASPPPAAAVAAERPSGPVGAALIGPVAAGNLALDLPGAARAAAAEVTHAHLASAAQAPRPRPTAGASCTPCAVVAAALALGVALTLSWRFVGGLGDPAPWAEPPVQRPQRPPTALAPEVPTAQQALLPPAIDVDASDPGSLRLLGEWRRCDGETQTLSSPAGGTPRLALMRYDVLQRAAAAPTAERPDLRIVAPMFTDRLAFVVAARSPLTAIHELQGRLIDAGPAGGPRAASAHAVYRALFGAAARLAPGTPDVTAALAGLAAGQGAEVVMLAGADPLLSLAALPAAQREVLRVLPLDPQAPAAARALRSYLAVPLAAGEAAATAPTTLGVLSFLVQRGDGDAGALAAASLCRHWPSLARDGDPRWRGLRPTLQFNTGWPRAPGVAAAWAGCPAP